MAKVFEPANFGLLLGSVPTEEGEKLGLVVEISGRKTEFCATLLDDLEIIRLILGSSSGVAGAEDQPDDLVPSLKILFELFGSGES